jgi:hypothetical protein
MSRQNKLLVSIVLGALSIACETVPAAPAPSRVHVWKLPEVVDAIDVSGDGMRAVLVAGAGNTTLIRAPWTSAITIAPSSGGALDARLLEGDRVMLVNRDGVLEVRSAVDGSEVSRQAVALAQSSKRALVTGDGRYVAFDSRVYDLEAKRWVGAEPWPAAQSAQAFSTSRYFLVAGFHDRRIVLQPLPGGAAREWRSEEKVGAAAISADGTCVASAGGDEVTLWSIEGRQQCQSDVGDHVEQVRVGESWLAAIGQKLTVLERPSCEKLASIRLRERASAVHIDADLIGVGDISGEVYVWDAKAGKLLARANAFRHPVRVVRVNASTRSVFAASEGETGGSEVQLLQLP